MASTPIERRIKIVIENAGKFEELSIEIGKAYKGLTDLAAAQDKVTKALAQVPKGSADYKALAAEQTRLATSMGVLVQRAAAGSATIREMEEAQSHLNEALKDVEVGSAAYLELGDSLRSVNSNLADIQKGVDAITLDDKVTAFSDFTKSVVSGFGLAQVALQGFSDGSDKSTRELLKLQNALAGVNVAIQFIDAVKQTFSQRNLAFARSLAISTAAFFADSEAVTLNAEAHEAGAVASTEAAVATGAATVAVEAEAAATVTATTATRGLFALLAANPWVIIATAIAASVVALVAYVFHVGEAEKALRTLNDEALRSANNAKSISLANDVASNRRAAIQKEIDLLKDKEALEIANAASEAQRNQIHLKYQDAITKKLTEQAEVDSGYNSIRFANQKVNIDLDKQTLAAENERLTKLKTGLELEAEYVRLQAQRAKAPKINTEVNDQTGEYYQDDRRSDDEKKSADALALQISNIEKQLKASGRNVVKVDFKGDGEDIDKQLEAYKSISQSQLDPVATALKNVQEQEQTLIALGQQRIANIELQKKVAKEAAEQDLERNDKRIAAQQQALALKQAMDAPDVDVTKAQFALFREQSARIGEQLKNKVALQLTERQIFDLNQQQLAIESQKAVVFSELAVKSHEVAEAVKQQELDQIAKRAAYEVTQLNTAYSETANILKTQNPLVTTTFKDRVKAIKELQDQLRNASDTTGSGKGNQIADSLGNPADIAKHYDRYKAIVLEAYQFARNEAVKTALAEEDAANRAIDAERDARLNGLKEFGKENLQVVKNIIANNSGITASQVTAIRNQVEADVLTVAEGEAEIARIRASGTDRLQEALNTQTTLTSEKQGEITQVVKETEDKRVKAHVDANKKIQAADDDLTDQTAASSKGAVADFLNQHAAEIQAIASVVQSGTQAIFDAQTQAIQNRIKEIDDQLTYLQNRASELQSQAQESISTIQDLESKLNDSRNGNFERLSSQLDAERSKRAGILEQQKKAAAEEKRLQKEKAAEEKKAFEVRKAQSIAQALINGALAVGQVLASTPPPLSFILAAATAVITGVQVATIASQKFAKGGLLKGPSHAAGGIQGSGSFGNVEVEGGEYVVNKNATAAFLPLLQAVNDPSSTQAPIAATAPDLGSVSTATRDNTVSVLREALESANLTTSFVDFTNKKKKFDADAERAAL